MEWANFAPLCRAVALPVCTLWSPPLPRSCPPRSLANNHADSTLPPVDNIADAIVAFLAFLIMLLLMRRTKRKLAAVGRKELLIYHTYVLLAFLCQIFSNSGFLRPAEISVRAFASIHVSAVVAAAWCFFLSSITMFQLVEDGAPLSFYGTLFSSVAWFVGTLSLCLDIAFDSIGGRMTTYETGYYKSSVLYGLYLIFPLLCVTLHVILSTILVTKQLGDRSPLGWLWSAVVFFVLAQVFLLASYQDTWLSSKVCHGTNGVIDGSVLSTACMMLAIYLSFRYWDAITEDTFDAVPLDPLDDPHPHAESPDKNKAVYVKDDDTNMIRATATIDASNE